MAGRGVADNFTSMGTRPAAVSTTKSTSVPAIVRQKKTRGSIPLCVSERTISDNTAVSKMAPPMGPAAACSGSLRPAR